MRSIFLCLILVMMTAGFVSAQPAGFEKQLKKYAALLRNENSAEKRAQLHYNIGVCLYRLGRAPAAIGKFETAINLRAGNYQKAFYALGMARVAAGDNGAAKKAFRSAIALNGKDGEAWFDLAMVFLAEKNFDEAYDAFSKAIENKSAGTVNAHNNIGVILAIKGNWQEAEKRFELAAGSEEGYMNLALCRNYRGSEYRELIAKLQVTKGEKRG